MADWKPVTLGPGGGRPAVGSVVVYRNDVLKLASQLSERLAATGYVEVVMNGAPHVVGLRAVTRRPGRGALKLLSGSRSGTWISCRRLLRVIGKQAPEQASAVPHRWDGEVLVLDLSGLPEAPATGG